MTGRFNQMSILDLPNSGKPRWPITGEFELTNEEQAWLVELMITGSRPMCTNCSQGSIGMWFTPVGRVCPECIKKLAASLPSDAKIRWVLVESHRVTGCKPGWGRETTAEEIATWK